MLHLPFKGWNLQRFVQIQFGTYMAPAMTLWMGMTLVTKHTMSASQGDKGKAVIICLFYKGGHVNDSVSLAK